MNSSAKMCMNCTSGEYQDEYTQTSCKPCPNPKDNYISGVGAKSISECKSKINLISESLKLGLEKMIPSLNWWNDMCTIMFPKI